MNIPKGKTRISAFVGNSPLATGTTVIEIYVNGNVNHDTTLSGLAQAVLRVDADDDSVGFYQYSTDTLEVGDQVVEVIRSTAGAFPTQTREYSVGYPLSVTQDALIVQTANGSCGCSSNGTAKVVGISN